MAYCQKCVQSTGSLAGCYTHGQLLVIAHKITESASAAQVSLAFYGLRRVGVVKVGHFDALLKHVATKMQAADGEEMRALLAKTSKVVLALREVRSLHRAGDAPTQLFIKSVKELSAAMDELQGQVMEFAGRENIWCDFALQVSNPMAIAEAEPAPSFAEKVASTLSAAGSVASALWSAFRSSTANSNTPLLPIGKQRQ